MIVEYRGSFYNFEHINDIKTGWLLAKNSNVKNVLEIVKMIRSMEIYGCKYEQHAQSINSIQPLTIQSIKQ